jgi:endonuclease YncB( thermonuclease family)
MSGARGRRRDRVAVNVGLPLAALAALLACAPHALAQTWPVGSEITGTVAEVVSGDTLIVAEGARKVTVRLADVVAPQGSEFFAPGARGLLSGMVQGEEVGVKVTGSAGPDSVFGRVVMQKLDVNLEMVKRGAAFVCWDYPVDTYFAPWETQAKRIRIGLWQGTWDINTRARCRQRPPLELAPPPESSTTRR